MELYTIYSFNKCFPKEIIKIILDYSHYECDDCKKYYDEGYLWSNDKYKCAYHYTIIQSYNTSNYLFKCIYCPDPAVYGYKDVICYCKKHIKNKKVIKYYGQCIIKECTKVGIFADNYYSYCIDHKNNNCRYNYADFRESKNIKSTEHCYDCKQLCEIFYYCKCNIKRCLKCYIICTYWLPDGSYCYLCTDLNGIRIRYYRVTFFCNVDTCYDLAEYVSKDKQKYSCKIHFTSDQYCILNKKCELCNLRALDKNYCINHIDNL